MRTSDLVILLLLITCLPLFLGLLQLACMTEHSCVPNSSYTTWGPELWLTATRTIKVGEALSIDYGNGFYKPAAERTELLKSSYGFDCKCELCTKVGVLWE